MGVCNYSGFVVRMRTTFSRGTIGLLIWYIIIIVNLSATNDSLLEVFSVRGGSCYSREKYPRSSVTNPTVHRVWAGRLLEITDMDTLKFISPSTCNSATYNSLSSYSTSDTLSSRTSTCSSFYSSGYSDNEWDDDSGSGDEIMEYRRRLSEESRKRMIKKLDSLRYNPNHHMRRIVPVGDGSTVDGCELLEVRIRQLERRCTHAKLLQNAACRQPVVATVCLTAPYV